MVNIFYLYEFLEIKSKRNVCAKCSQINFSKLTWFTPVLFSGFCRFFFSVSERKRVIEDVIAVSLGQKNTNRVKTNIFFTQNLKYSRK